MVKLIVDLMYEGVKTCVIQFPIQLNLELRIWTTCYYADVKDNMKAVLTDIKRNFGDRFIKNNENN